MQRKGNGRGDNFKRAAVRFPAALLLALAMAGSVSAGPGETFDRIIAPYETMNDASGAVVVSENGKIIYEKGFGFSDRDIRTQNTPWTRFRIGSLNKQLTAACILLLEERGKLSTDDALAKHFPDFPNGQKITIKQLLTHRSGLPKYIPYNGGGQPTSAELLRLIATLEPDAEPGTRYGYSNAGFVLLALIVEKVSGTPFPKFLVDNVFKPLRMRNSGVGINNAKIARGYVTGVGNAVLSAPSLAVFNFEVYSTAEDLDRWQVGLYNGKLIAEKSLAKLTTDYGDRYGFGISVRKTPRVSYGHDGVISGYAGFVFYFPDRRISVTYLGNIESGAMGELQSMLPAAALGDKVEPVKVRTFADTIDKSRFAKFVGRYEVFPGFFLDVRYREGELSLRGPMGAFIALTPVSEKEFFYRHLYANVAFVADADGKIVRLDWTDRGGTYPCKKRSETYPEN